MLLIDRYLLRQFAQNLLIFFCSLTGLYIIIDSFNNLEEFITFAEQNRTLITAAAANAGECRAGGGERGIARQHVHGYGRLLLAACAISFFDRTSGILTLISAMFTVTWIQRHNELTALQAAGVAKFRVLRPGSRRRNGHCHPGRDQPRDGDTAAFKYGLSHNAQNLGELRAAQGTPAAIRQQNRRAVPHGQQMFRQSATNP